MRQLADEAQESGQCARFMLRDREGIKKSVDK